MSGWLWGEGRRFGCFKKNVFGGLGFGWVCLYLAVYLGTYFGYLRCGMKRYFGLWEIGKELERNMNEI